MMSYYFSDFKKLLLRFLKNVKIALSLEKLERQTESLGITKYCI